MNTSTDQNILILGAGQAAGTAIATLRQMGHERPITLVGDEAEPPYQRPPLSKAYIKGSAGPESLMFRPEKFYQDQKIELLAGRAVSIDRAGHKVLLASGETLPYGHLVLATGARNRLLGEDGPPDRDWLAALEAQMADHGAAIDAARRATVAALGERLADQPEGPFARAGLRLEGWTGGGATLATDLAQSRARDAVAGRALVGPHRSDLAVTHLGKGQAAALCSTGEQKALLLGLILAHAGLVAERTGAPPILLLDEVAAHLDPVRRAALFERLAGRGQVWMTGTEPGLFTDVPGEATRVEF